MTDEESHITMLKVGSDAAMAVSVAVGGCTEGFDHDPQQVEELLVDALTTLLEEIEDGAEEHASRGELLLALRARKEAR